LTELGRVEVAAAAWLTRLTGLARLIPIATRLGLPKGADAQRPDQ
jgi:hypothetical protein